MIKVIKPQLNDSLLSNKDKDFENYKTEAAAHQQRVCKEGATKRTINDISYPKTKAVLLDLYHYKCGFCERKLVEIPNRPNEATVEHYRPKNKNLYYWLGAEWTNLFPTCSHCQKRGDDFQILETKIKNPFNKAGEFDARLFDTKFLNDLEKPKLLHPEYDDGKDFFKFDANAKISPLDTLYDEQKNRADYTIKILNLNNVEKKPYNPEECISFLRKKVLENYRATIKKQYVALLENYGSEIDERNTRLAFDSIFKSIFDNHSNKTAEFKLLHHNIIWYFNELITMPVVKELIEMPFDAELSDKDFEEVQPIITLLDTVFLDFRARKEKV